MENKTIIHNVTLEQYKKKYKNRDHRLLKYTKKQVEEFDKQYGHYIFNNKTYNLEFDYFLLKNRRWALIGDTYYEIPKPIRFTWFRNLNAGVQAVTCLVGIGAVSSAVVFPTLFTTVWKKGGDPVKPEPVVVNVLPEYFTAVDKGNNTISLKYNASSTIPLPTSLKIKSNYIVNNVEKTVVELERFAFDANDTGVNLSTIELPNTLTTIGDGTFLNNTNLTTITIPASVTTMGYNILSCTSGSQLNSATFLDSTATWNVEKIGDTYGPAADSNYTPTSENFTTTKEYLIDNFSNEGHAYKWTKNVTEDLPIYLNAETVGQEEDNTIKISYSGTGTLPTALDIKSKYKVNGVEKTVIEIKDEGFYHNQDIEKIIIGKEIKKIGTSAFCGCSKVNEVTFEENSKLTDLNYACFAWLNSNLKTFTIPKQVNNIDNPFERDFGLTSFVVLSDNFTTILNGSALVSADKKILYSYPTATGELDFSIGELNTIEILADHSLNNVINITNIIFSNNITKIGNYSCINLEALNPSNNTITIPSSVKEIGSLAFASLPSSITKIHFDDATGWHIGDLSGQTIDLSNDTNNKEYFSESWQQILKLVKA